jgi:TolB-like protein
LTRAELQRQLWPDGTFVDFEHGLNAAMKRLRAAIGDSAARPRFIETLPRLGYRFIAPVEILAPERIDGRRVAARDRAPTEQPILALLRFRRAGDRGTSRDFAESLADGLAVRLGQLAGRRFKVIARAASRVAERHARTVSEAAEVLGATHALGGAIRYGGDRVRVTAELIDTRDQAQVWADVYESRLEEPFAAESQIAADVAAAVSLALTSGSGMKMRPQRVGRQEVLTVQ